MVREGGELALGTAVGQLLPAAVGPALARYYTPSQFGVFALFAGVVSIVAVMLGGRFELGILIPVERREETAGGICLGVARGRDGNAGRRDWRAHPA